MSHNKSWGRSRSLILGPELELESHKKNKTPYYAKKEFRTNA